MQTKISVKARESKAEVNFNSKSLFCFCNNACVEANSNDYRPKELGDVRLLNTWLAVVENLGRPRSNCQTYLGHNHKFITQKRDCIMFSLEIATEESIHLESEGRVPSSACFNIKNGHSVHQNFATVSLKLLHFVEAIIILILTLEHFASRPLRTETHSQTTISID
jgi:hypothetical protein